MFLFDGCPLRWPIRRAMGSTKNEVQVSYDVSNEFFRLWLDERMNYTCGAFDDTDNLEEAQVKKLNIIHDFAHITPDKRVPASII